MSGKQLWVTSMGIPDYQTLMLPVLKGAQDGEVRISDVIGSLDRFMAAKGVFATTSDFTKDAEETASMLSKQIVLVNGQRLSDLMSHHNVGCRIEKRLPVEKIDEDYFSE